MSVPARSILRDAMGLVRFRLVLEQAALVAVVAGLSVLWLHVPDASAMDVVGSVLLGLVIVWVAGAGETALFLRLCEVARTRRRLLLGALLVLIGAVLWTGACSLIGHAERTDYLRAGYLNSRVSFRWRNLFSFDHIILLLRWMWTALRWIVAGVIAGFVFPATAGVRRVNAILRVLRSTTYWVTLVVGAVAASTMTGLLMNWMPGHGLRAETVSLVVRLGVALLMDCAVAVLVLAMVAVCVRRLQAAYETPGGTPEESQPRTVDKP